MCLEPPEKEREFSYMDVADPVHSSDKDVVARQFSDLMQYARGSDSMGDYTSKLDLAPQVEKKTTLTPTGYADKPVNAGFAGSFVNAVQQTPAFFTNSTLPSNYSKPAPHNPSMPFANFGKPLVHSETGTAMQGRIPVYGDVQNNQYRPDGSFYNKVAGMDDQGATNYQTSFIQSLRDGDIASVLQQFGVSDLLGQSRKVRGVGKANIGQNQSTPQKVVATPAAAPTGGSGKQEAGISSGLKLPEAIFNSTIKPNAVRSVG